MNVFKTLALNGNFSRFTVLQSDQANPLGSVGRRRGAQLGDLDNEFPYTGCSVSSEAFCRFVCLSNGA